ncbi:MAG: 5'-nucleotidase, lipoprotein e(P4) family [Weeksellaceae bacterium]
MKKFTLVFYGILMLGTAVSCKTSFAISSNPTTQESIQRGPHDIDLNGKIYSSLWQQNAGEFRALCYQAFNAAKLVVDNELRKFHKRPLAIIADIDETILDNSPYAVTQAKKGNDFNLQTWLEWTSLGAAEPYAGSVAFFNYAAEKGIRIFYISNRNMNDKPGTLMNLKNLGFPFANDEHILVMTDTSNKEARRQAVLKDHEVILYMGDNLTDFAEVFYKAGQEKRNRTVDEMADAFGKKFIVLPNANYGDWESALPGYNSWLPIEKMDSVILNNVKGY